MGVYTKTGDKGTTGLLTGERIDKDSVRVEAYGSVDEINSVLGLARAFCDKTDVCEEIFSLQKLLMLVMAELASSGAGQYITVDHVGKLEKTIDIFESKLPELTHFIVPGGKKGGAFLDVARTVTRRAERQVWRLRKNESVSEPLVILLNRLSDFCFVLMRYEEQD